MLHSFIAAQARLFAVAAICSCLGCSTYSHQYTRTVNQELETEPLSALDLTTFNGSIEVQPVEGPFVYVEAKFTGYGNSEEEAEANSQLIDHTIVASEGVVTINATKPENTWMASASYVVKLPPHCELRLSTSNGAVSASGFGNTAHISTSNGAIEISNMQAVVCKTSNGRIQALDIAGPVHLKTSNGRIQFRGNLAEPQGEFDNEIKTSNGRITIELSPEQAVAIDASTSNGSISCDLPIHNAQEQSSKSLVALIGDNTAAPIKLNAKTSNGSISIGSYAPNNEAADNSARKDTADIDTAAEVAGDADVPLTQ